MSVGVTMAARPLGANPMPSHRIDLRADVGQLLVVGFDGVTLADATRRALARGERAGTIFFRRNLPSMDALRDLSREVDLAMASAGDGLLPIVALDQEGGRVTRLAAPFPVLPPMRVLGRAGAETVERAGEIVGRGLAHLGVTMNFAPVLDVDSNPMNPVIGDRAFSSDPRACAELGLAFARGLAQGGVLACGKHFPGHGDTSVDSHLDLPVLTHDRARLDAIELAPFVAACGGGIDSLMSAHVVCESIDPGVPATLSHRISTDLLRGELGFDGVLFSDDLEMRAIAAKHAPAESAVLAVRAGCDAVLVCRDESASAAAFDALLAEAERDETFRARIAEAARRVRTLRAAIRPRRVRALGSPPPWEDDSARRFIDGLGELANRPASFDPTEHGRT